MIYPAILVLVSTLFIMALSGRSPTGVLILRGPGLPFNTLASGEISNQVRVRVTNRTHQEQAYSVELEGVDAGRLVGDSAVVIGPDEHKDMKLVLAVPRDAFREGRLAIQLRVTDDDGNTTIAAYKMLGPNTPGGTPRD